MSQNGAKQWSQNGVKRHQSKSALQSQPLLARHLPPQTLPFQNFASRVAESAQEEEVADSGRGTAGSLEGPPTE